MDGGLGGGRALPRHVPKPIQPGPCLALGDRSQRQEGPSEHLCPTPEDAGDQQPAIPGTHRGTGGVI